MALEYDGSTSGAPNPDAVDSSGDATVGASVGPSPLGQLLADLFNGLFGIPSAQASSYPVNVGGKPIGFTTLTGVSGMTLAQALIAQGAKIDKQGTILDRNGYAAGKLDLGSPGFATIGPINADIATMTMTTTVDGQAVTSAVVPDGLAGQLTAIDGVTLQPVTPVWRWGGCSSVGVTVMDPTNISNLFVTGGTLAYLRPGFIGGRDGIYSLHTGRRVVPPEGTGHPAAAGFGLGATASYAKANVAMGWASAGHTALWGYYGGDWMVVIDPATGQPLVPAAWVALKVWDGSQQVSTDGYSWDYPSAPSAASPRYNSTVSGKVAYCNAATNAAFLTYTPGTNPGGPDGGASR